MTHYIGGAGEEEGKAVGVRFLAPLICIKCRRQSLAHNFVSDHFSGSGPSDANDQCE
ncbi:hypothetical protein [Methylovirgula sp. HY1]|uniref:hypothetical protein n=1 Tax=Methylovirgula sp. HY1 TaxID=2822761 RepID=UPI001C5B4433|nr:hypothetical protein [Methylovirgula sp. HY1]